MPNPKPALFKEAIQRAASQLKKIAAKINKIGTNNVRATGIILVTLLIGFLIFNNTQVNNLANENKDFYAGITSEERAKANSIFTIGIFIQKVSAFDPQAKTFAADGYAWLKWKEPIGSWSEWDEVIKEDPALTLEFLNAVEHWDFVKDVSPEDPYIDSDGWSYQSVLFSGRFLANDIDLRRFPFESITLPIEIEAEDFWITDLIFETDKSGSSGISSKNALQGYTLDEATFLTRKHVYKTSMGLNADAKEEFLNENVSIYPNFLTELRYTRSFAASSWQLLLPLGVVSSVAFLTPMIDARAAEAKIALPASVILTLVFLQDGYKKMLPSSLSYLTLLDKFYISMYISALAIFAVTIWYANKITRTPDAKKHKTALAIRKQETTANFAVITFLCIVLVGIWIAS